MATGQNAPYQVYELTNGPAAMEAKLVGDWPESPYNPNSNLPFSIQINVDEIVEQALKYGKKYDGVRWITNSRDFIVEYTDRFKKAGVKKFTFMLIPAMKESK